MGAGVSGSENSGSNNSGANQDSTDDPKGVSGSGGKGGGKSGGSEGGNSDPSASAQQPTGLSENWRSDMSHGLDQDIQDSFIKIADRYTSPAEFAKGVVDLRKSHDSRVSLPDDKTKDEDRHKFFVRLGKPNEAKEYAFNHAQDAPELNDVEVEAREGFREIAHRLHLTQPQVDGLVQWNDEQRKLGFDGFSKAAQSFADQTKDVLEKQWGPDFEKNIEAANAAKAEFGSEGFEEFKNLRLSDGRIVGDHPALVDLLAKVGRELETDDERRVRNLHGTEQADDLQSQIDAIEQEAIEKGKSTADPEYHRRLQPLYEKLHGTKSMSPIRGFGGR